MIHAPKLGKKKKIGGAGNIAVQNGEEMAGLSSKVSCT
jgi:hypothetical protein